MVHTPRSEATQFPIESGQRQCPLGPTGFLLGPTGFLLGATAILLGPTAILLGARNSSHGAVLLPDKHRSPLPGLVISD